MKAISWSCVLALGLPVLALGQSLETPQSEAWHVSAVANLEAQPRLEYDESTILVKFLEQTPDDVKASLHGLVLGTKLHGFDIVPDLELIQVRNPKVAIDVLSVQAFVEYAELNYVVQHFATPNDTYYSLMWGLHNTGQSILGDAGTADSDIDAPEAWDVYSGDANFVIADIDTGMQTNHPDLAANLWRNPGEIAGNGVDDDGNGYIDDINGWDFYSRDNNPADSAGHGTHTAGTIGAVGNNGVGVTGVNWRCKIAPLRFLGPSGGFTSDAVLALQYCVGKNIKVSNNSWGGGGFSQSLFNAISNSRSIGHVFVAAAGNGGADQIGDNNDSIPNYPSSYNVDNIISVAATDNDDRRASFSNYGASSVDLAAPGVNIASTYINSGYVYMSGTSMATPHVTGVVGLIYARNPTWTYTQVRSQVLNTVRPVSFLSGITVTGGLLNAAAALGGGAPPVTIPTAPSNCTATNLGGGSARVNWIDRSNNETRFEVQRQRRVGGSWTNTTTAGTTNANITMLTNTPGAGRYRYRVRAGNSAGNSAWSNWAQVVVN